MRILFYSYEYPPLGGGTGNATKNLFKQFTKDENLEIDFITSSLDGKYKREKRFKNITFYMIPTGVRSAQDYHSQKPINMILFTWRAYWLTWKLILKNKYNLSHFFGFPGGLVSLLFRWKMPYVISLRGVDVPGYNKKFKKYYIFYKPLSWLIWKFASFVVTNSRKLTELAIKTSKSIRYKIIPNGVDVNLWKPAKESQKFKKFSITAGGTRMIKRKGLKYLIQGFAKFNKEFKTGQLLLMSDGEEIVNLKNLVKKLKLEKAVIFNKVTDNSKIQQLLPKFHVFCLPSLNEGMCNAALEALACGLPLILTETGGTKELINGNGHIVRMKSANDVYDKIKMLYQDKSQRIEMGRRSREMAGEMSWEKAAGEYIKLYFSM